jgi:ubiquinone/menaquinone biosynthesis C-methylase UbiE
MKITNCPICGSQDKQNLKFTNLKDIFGFTTGTFNVVRCGECECLYLQNPMEENEVYKAYPANYDCYKNKINLFSKIKNLIVRKECNRLIKKSNKGEEGLRVLEIGAGTGLYANYFNKHGHETWATDISEKSLSDLAAKGIKTCLGKFENIDFKDNFFDIIIMSHVIEHFYNPNFVFHKLHKILKTGGLVYIKTPAASSWFLNKYSKVLDVPRHIVILSRKTITKIIKDRFNIIWFCGEITTNEFINYFQLKYKKNFFSYSNIFLIIIFLPLAVIFWIFRKYSRMNLIIKKI